MKTGTSTKLLFLLFCLYTLGSTTASARQVKFGKVDDSELTMKVYEQDTSAAAVVLSDVGYSYFSYNKGFRIIFERHTRIKILKKSGYDAADIEVPYYRANSNKEQVHSIKGYTYNLEGGKVQKDKLEGKAVFEEQTDENWYTKKFTMPNVKEGSVIEYSYTISSDFLYNLREWEFQSTIPVAYSEYKARIPEYFTYKLDQQGYLPFNVSTSEWGKEHFTVRWESEITPGIRGGRTPGGATQVEANSLLYHWVVKDAPALRPEKFITTLRDYQSKIEFELQTVKFPGQLPQVMTGNWDQLTRELLEAERFGLQLNRKGFFKNEIAALVAKYDEPALQMAAIYDLVKNTVKWNNKSSYYASGPIRKAFENRTGNTADINLMLTAMLQEAGLDAAPVLVSTREHGRAPQGAPMINKFNYVISHVQIGDKEYLLDATEPLLPAGMLPVRCLNGQGRLIKKNDQRWVTLASAGSYSRFFNGQITINEQGEMKGSATESNGGYNALLLRKAILEEGEDKYTEQIGRELGNFTIEKPAVQNLHDLNSSLNVNYSLSASGNGQVNKVLYINPMLGYGEKENPFKLEERLYPVDFAAPIDQTYVCSIVIPDGYELDEAPKATMVSLPDNGGRFMYMVEKQGNAIQIMSKINITKPVFYAPEYNYLKEFYNQIVAKHAEQIVLKRVATAEN